MIDSIETHVESAAVAVEDGSNQLSKATDHAKSARKKKWICCVITFILLIIIILVVYFQVIAPLIAASNGQKGKDGANGTSGTGTTQQ
jgi:syntaxin 1B/2/3